MTTLLFLIVLGLLFRLTWAANQRSLSALALSRRADAQHQLVLMGHPRGIYGDYPPAQL